MSTLSPYLAPFLDSNWITDTANTISANNFSAKTNLSALINFWFVICFLLIITCEALPHRGYSTQSFASHVREFAVAICRENMPQEFAEAICCGFFVFISKSSFVYVSKSCFYQSRAFLYVSKTFLFVKFSLLTVLLFVIAVAVMGHHNSLNLNSCFQQKMLIIDITFIEENFHIFISRGSHLRCFIK